MTDALGSRMKGQYEDRMRYMLPRRTYTIIRVDGRSFKRYTNRFVKPYDELLARVLLDATVWSFKELGAKLAYQQSDEASFLLTDFAKPETCALFDGNVQKLASIAASMFTGYFVGAVSQLPPAYFPPASYPSPRAYVCPSEKWPMAQFDARVFVIPDPVEVYNYFVWRQKDCMRNSVLGSARRHFGPKAIHGLDVDTLKDKLADSDVDWCNEPDEFRLGTVVSDPGASGTSLDVFKFTDYPNILQEQIPKQWALQEAMT